MDERLFFLATERNKKYILEELSKLFLKKGYILEIGSGSGEHAVFFQKYLKDIIWQTSDPNNKYLKSIKSWIAYEGLSNKMPEPLNIDVQKTPWPINSEIIKSINCIVCINMIHITPWEYTEKLFEESGKILRRNHILFIYGPFKKNNKHISESNKEFDNDLKNENNKWGVRDLEKVNKIAYENNFFNPKIIKMPANNFCLIYRKKINSYFILSNINN